MVSLKLCCLHVKTLIIVMLQKKIQIVMSIETNLNIYSKKLQIQDQPINQILLILQKIVKIRLINNLLFQCKILIRDIVESYKIKRKIRQRLQLKNNIIKLLLLNKANNNCLNKCNNILIQLLAHMQLEYLWILTNLNKNLLNINLVI